MAAKCKSSFFFLTNIFSTSEVVPQKSEFLLLFSQVFYKIWLCLYDRAITRGQINVQIALI